MIGLVDLQLQSWDKPQLCPPNLEIMKLATYYKTEENRFCRIINLDETELTKYETIYIFSESKDYITVPEHFKRASNVVYGGTAFTNGIYVPFENKLIDYTLARTYIYYEFLKEKRAAGLDDKQIDKFIDNSYYRWHAGKESLPIPPIQKRHRIYIYDKDFFQNGWRKIIDKIIARNPTSIQFIHPMRYNNISDFLEVRENSLISNSNDAFLDLNVSLNDTNSIMKSYKNRLLATITSTSQVYLSLGGSFHYKTNYYRDLIYKLNLLYIFWGHGIPLKLKYEEPALGCYNPVSDLSKMIAIWTQGKTCHYKNIIEKIPKDKKLTEVRPEREQLREVLKQLSSDTLFRQTFETVRKGGAWKHGY